MRKTILKKRIGETTILFEEINGKLSLILLPSSKENEVDFKDESDMDSLIQLCLSGDIHYSSYSSGQTMRDSQTANSFKLVNQKIDENDDYCLITTTLENEAKLKVVNSLKYKKKYDVIETYNTLINNSDTKILVEKFDSFSLAGISPFKIEKPDIYIHKMLGNWSAEGRHVVNSIQSLGLEQSWANFGLRIDKIGSACSMPVKNHFPFVCIEDKTDNVFWGILMEAPSSWDIEIARVNRYISVSGGMGDYEYAHIRKTVKPSESYATTTAYLTVTDKNIDSVFNKLRNGLESPIYSKKEAKLPIIFNEYCTSWANPTHETVIKAAFEAKKIGAEYFVIDAGWYCKDSSLWCKAVGDYEVYKPNFKDGIDKTADEIRKLGLIPGIWFEIECVSIYSKIFKDHPDWLLRRDGHIIISGERAFLDFRKKVVISYLKKTVIDFLKNNHFGYIKIDYNECIGIGIDGKESYGYELTKQNEAVLSFINLIRRKVRGIVIEVCASGGHKLEPLNLALGDMESFSDAHECHEGAVIAANVNRIVPTYKNQIWGVVRDTYSSNEIRYSLTKTMFGRLCLSGDLTKLNPEQLDIVTKFVKIYKKTRYIIKEEENIYLTDNSEQKYLSLEGEQVVIKLAKDKKAALLIIHGFNNSKEVTIEHDCLTSLKIKDVFSSPNFKYKKNGNKITFKIDDFDGAVIHLTEQ